MFFFHWKKDSLHQYTKSALRSWCCSRRHNHKIFCCFDNISILTFLWNKSLFYDKCRVSSSLHERSILRMWTRIGPTWQQCLLDSWHTVLHVKRGQKNPACQHLTKSSATSVTERNHGVDYVWLSCTASNPFSYRDLDKLFPARLTGSHPFEVLNNIFWVGFNKTLVFWQPWKFFKILKYRCWRDRDALVVKILGGDYLQDSFNSL